MNKLRFLAGLAVLGLTFAMSSCVRKDFDAPPDNSGYDPALTVTHTIAQLKAMNGAYVSTTSYDTTLITEDVVVSGVVVADDRSGNFYKQIVIQDSTGGIAININAYSLYVHYPVGRKIYVKCKGLYLGYDGGLPILGAAVSEQKSINGLESSEIDAHLIKANIGNFVKDTVISLATANQANPFFYNRLVTIADVEFQDTTRTFTEPSATTNRSLVNCAALSGQATLVTRNSNYANFHALRVPSGHGSVTGILTVYQPNSNSKTAQIVIRDTSDVKMYEPRCTGVIPPPVGSIFSETFATGTGNTDVNLAGWTNYAEAGTVKWKYGTGGSAANKPYAQVTAFSTSQADVKSWLVTPAINLTGATTPKFSFISSDGYDNGATLTVMISTNFAPGGNPANATWTTLNPTISTGHASTYGPFISSGNVDLSAYAGQTVYIAFKYVGSDVGTKKTTTFEIDNVTVTKN